MRINGDEAAPRDRIVTAAEALFARKGFHGVPLREIAREAGINVNLVSYYFPTKDNLFDTVVDLRATKLNEMRAQALDALDAQHSPNPVPVQDIIRSLVHPFFALHAQDMSGWSAWNQLLNREMGTEIWIAAMVRNLSPVLRRYLYTLHRALPSAKRSDLVFILELTTRAMVLASEVDVTVLVPEADAADWTNDLIEDRIVRSLTAAALAFSG